MQLSRTKFTLLFVLSGFLFLFVTTSLLGTAGLRGFPKAPDSVLHTGSDSPLAWKRAVSTVILPVKIVLLGPLVTPGAQFLDDDPPPPFIGLFLVGYWTLLAWLLNAGLARPKSTSSLR